MRACMESLSFTLLPATTYSHKKQGYWKQGYLKVEGKPRTQEPTYLQEMTAWEWAKCKWQWEWKWKFTCLIPHPGTAGWSRTHRYHSQLSSSGIREGGVPVINRNSHLRKQVMLFKPKTIDEECVQAQYLENIGHKKGQPSKVSGSKKK